MPLSHSSWLPYFFGIAAGQSYEEIIKSIQKGMGDTLGFTAIVGGPGCNFRAGIGIIRRR